MFYFSFLKTQVEVSSPGEREPECGLLGQTSTSSKCEKATSADNTPIEQEATKSDISKSSTTTEGRHPVTLIEIFCHRMKKKR
jgi:hypothetical protein